MECLYASSGEILSTSTFNGICQHHLCMLTYFMLTIWGLVLHSYDIRISLAAVLQ